MESSVNNLSEAYDRKAHLNLVDPGEQTPETELQNTKELRAKASEIAAPKPEELDATAKKRRF